MTFDFYQKWFEFFSFQWCPRPDSNWHSQKGKDFKSFVSTNFTTRAWVIFISVYANIYNWTRWISKFFLFYLFRYKSSTSSPILSYRVLVKFTKMYLQFLGLHHNQVFDSSSYNSNSFWYQNHLNLSYNLKMLCHYLKS